MILFFPLANDLANVMVSFASCVCIMSYYLSDGISLTKTLKSVECKTYN